MKQQIDGAVAGYALDVGTHHARVAYAIDHINLMLHRGEIDLIAYMIQDARKQLKKLDMALRMMDYCVQCPDKAAEIIHLHQEKKE